MPPLVDVVKLSEKKCQRPIQVNLKYASKNNFVGQVIDGYDANVTDIALMTPKAAESLCKVQFYLLRHYDYSLLIYDAYRPKRAVQHFIHWSQHQTKDPEQLAWELERKAKHYPHIHKSELFKLGFVSKDSDHCYGNTVDLVLIDNNTQKELPMGARFDYMDDKSDIHVGADVIGEDALRNRKILAEAMQKFGFKPYHKEFWHFSHGGNAGREVTNPIDVPITASLRGIGVPSPTRK